jgi:mannose-binding lectin 2
VLQPAVKEAAPVVTKPKKSKSGGSVFSVLLKMMLAGGLLGGLFMGYKYYEQRNTMKRF